MNIFINYETGDGVMLFFENETLTPQQAETWAKNIFPDVIEAYEVRDDELQYYVYEPLRMTDAMVRAIKEGGAE